MSNTNPSVSFDNENSTISFKTGNPSSTERLRINNNGAIGIGGANYGSVGQVLTSNGDSAVSWETPAAGTGTNTTYSFGTGLNVDGTTISNPYNSFFPGTKLFNFSQVGIHGVARVDFTNGQAFAFHGSYYGGGYLDMMYTGYGIQIGCTDGSAWRNSQLLGLDATNGEWYIYDFSGTGSQNSIYPSSDDRIKTHEEVFSGETYINYVKQIVPKKYRKYGVILTAEEEKLLEEGGDPFADRRTGDPVKDSVFTPKIEYGVIAQDIHKIAGLEDIVSVGDSTKKWKVDYRSLDTITLGAVKGLIDKIEKLEERIKVLEGRTQQI